MLPKGFVCFVLESEPAFEGVLSAGSFRHCYASVVEDLPVNSKITIAARDLSWSASRAGGKGGQHVNKTSTKVDLRFDLESCGTLHPAVKKRLKKKRNLTIDSDGRIVVVSSQGRSQSSNLQDARRRLASLIRSALRPPKRRIKTKPTRGSKKRRLKAKQKQAEKKARRKKVDY